MKIASWKKVMVSILSVVLVVSLSPSWAPAVEDGNDPEGVTTAVLDAADATGDPASEQSGKPEADAAVDGESSDVSTDIEDSSILDDEADAGEAGSDEVEAPDATDEGDEGEASDGEDTVSDVNDDSTEQAEDEGNNEEAAEGQEAAEDQEDAVTPAAPRKAARAGSKPGVRLTLKDASGNALASGATINRTDRVYGQLDIVFSDDPAVQPYKPEANGNRQFRYQFPWGMDAVPTQQDIITNGRKAGSYKIETDGNGNSWVTFSFDQAWLAANPNGIKAGCTFEFKFTRNVVENSDEWSGVFPLTDGGTTIHFNPGGVLGYKSAGAPDANGDVTFTVTFTLKAATKNFQVIDEMGKNLSFVDGSFAFGPSGQQENVSSKMQVTDKGATWEAVGTIGDLDAGRYLFTYKAHVNEEAAKNLEVGVNLDDVTNSITWKYGEPGKETVSEPDSATPRITREALNKKIEDIALDETTDADGNKTYTIKWSITINNGTLKVDDLSNKDLTDTIETGTYNGDLVVTDASGNVYTGGKESSHKEGKEGFTYTFGPDAGKGHYTFTYTTTLKAKAEDDGIEPAQVKNKASMQVEGSANQGESATDITIPGVNPDKINKEAGERQEDGDKGRTSWKIQVGKENIWTTNANNDQEVADSVVIEDKLSGKGVSYDRASLKVHLKAADGTELPSSDYTLAWPSGGFTVTVEKSVLERLDTSDGYPLFVTYDTLDDGTMGEVTNESNIKTKKEDEVVADYQDKESMSITNNGGLLKRNQTVAWDDAKNCWVITWVVQGNTSVDYAKALGGKVDISGAPFTVSDTLGEGLSYVAGSAQYKLLADGYWDSDYERDRFSYATWTKADVQTSGQTVTISTKNLSPFEYHAPVTDDKGNPVTNEDGSAKTEAKISSGEMLVYLQYQTYVDNAVLETKAEGAVASKVKEVSNHVSADIGGEPFETEATATVNENQLSKNSMRMSGTNKLTYTINFNDQARDLYDKGDTLTLVDTMDPRTTFDQASLKVTADGEDITSTVLAAVSDVSNAGGASSQLTLKVPDGKRLVISYNVLLNGVSGEDLAVNNEVEVVEIDVPPVVNNGNFDVLEESGYAEGSGKSVNVHKIDTSGNDITTGATFALYSIDLDSWNASADDAANIAAAGTLVDSATTDEYGYAGLADTTIGANSTSLHAARLYAIVEVAAPVGYALATVPFYVMLQSSDADAYEKALDKCAELGIAPRTAADGLTVEVHDELGMEMYIEKKWNDNNNAAQKRPDAVAFQILQNGQPYTVVNFTAQEAQSESNANVWDCVVGGLPRYDENGELYAYTTVEMPVMAYRADYSAVETEEALIDETETVISQVTVTNTYIGTKAPSTSTAKTADIFGRSALYLELLGMLALIAAGYSLYRRSRQL